MPMDVAATTDPFSLLREIEESCRVCNTQDFRQTTEIFSEWSGIAFRVGGNNLLAPLDEVVEILDMPKLARVPLAQPWVCGIANVRGNLLPVVDLSGFLGGEVAPLEWIGSRQFVISDPYLERRVWDVAAHSDLLVFMALESVFGLPRSARRSLFSN